MVIPVTIMMVSSISMMTMTILMSITMVVISVVMTPIPVAIATMSTMVVAVVTIARRCVHVLGLLILIFVLVSGNICKNCQCLFSNYVCVCDCVDIDIPFDITATIKKIIANVVDALKNMVELLMYEG